MSTKSVGLRVQHPCRLRCSELLVPLHRGVGIGEERWLALCCDALPLLLLELLNGLRWRGQLLWWCAALLDDNVTYCRAYVMVCAISCCLTRDGWVVAQLPLGERCAKEVGGKLVGPHPNENLLTLLQPLAPGDHGDRLACVQAAITVILEGGKTIARDTSSVRRLGQLLVVASQFRPYIEPELISPMPCSRASSASSASHVRTAKYVCPRATMGFSGSAF